MDFPIGWVSLIMRCVSLVSFLVLVNGSPHDEFFPQRKLKQGDPLSPYLFIRCVEVLFAMINKVVAQGCLHGLKIYRFAPIISHLFITGNIIFTKATKDETMSLATILKKYETTTG